MAAPFLGRHFFRVCGCGHRLSPRTASTETVLRMTDQQRKAAQVELAE
ncbi:MAG: hypothetical protein ACRCTP_17715 [Aeromonas popoffii]